MSQPTGRGHGFAWGSLCCTAASGVRLFIFLAGLCTAAVLVADGRSGNDGGASDTECWWEVCGPKAMEARFLPGSAGWSSSPGCVRCKQGSLSRRPTIRLLAVHVGSEQGRLELGQRSSAAQSSLGSGLSIARALKQSMQGAKASARPRARASLEPLEQVGALASTPIYGAQLPAQP